MAVIVNIYENKTMLRLFKDIQLEQVPRAGEHVTHKPSEEGPTVWYIVARVAYPIGGGIQLFVTTQEARRKDATPPFQAPREGNPSPTSAERITERLGLVGKPRHVGRRHAP